MHPAELWTRMLDGHDSDAMVWVGPREQADEGRVKPNVAAAGTITDMRHLPLLVALAAALLACGGDDATPAASASSSGAGGAAATSGAGAGTSTGVSSSGSGGTSTGSSGAGGGGACLDATLRQGEGTYYAADGSGNCSFPATPGDLMVAAMNHSDYAASALCGACIDVAGPDGSVQVRIVDRCPECAPGDVDLSPEAFALIAPLSAGRVPISWTLVECPVQGPVVYHFKEGSNPYWSAIQLRNHRHPIAKLEAIGGAGEVLTFERADYNYFIHAAGLGDGPYQLRVTDVLGETLADDAVPFAEDSVAPGATQFSACP
jgi:expansin (peptidoglycan-binding protein)